MTRDDLQEKIRTLEAALEEARGDSARKSEMIAMVAHELRTPLGAIISMSDLMQATALDRTQRHYCETLQFSARGLLSVLNDILDLSKLQAGRMELNVEETDLEGLLKGVETVLHAKGREKGLKTRVVRKPGLPRRVAIDQMRLRQIIANLTDNAVKFTPSGAVTVSVDYEFGSEGAGMLRVEVADTGPGIAPDLRERLFEPYQQGGGAVAAKHGGTGLGLAIVRDLVRLLGGEIGLRDAGAEAGSCFWFEVPCEALRAPDGLVGMSAMADMTSPRQAVAQDAPPDQAPPAVKRHLLVIEDNKINQTLIGVFLDKFAMSYTMVSRGEEAVEAVCKERFDAVLMDIRMSGLDGVETTQRIRALGGAYERLPIIALTAYAMEGDADRFLAAGMNAYVAKPIEPRDLYVTIENAIAGSIAGKARPA